jgi:hypothetical protein
MLRCSLIALLVVGIALPAFAGLPQPRRSKIIDFRGTSLEFIRNNPGIIDQSPVDGMLVRVAATRDGREVLLEQSVFGKEAMRYEDFAAAVAEIRATDLRTLTDNFLCVYVVPGDLDWFGDCSAFINNARVAARVAREGGLKGICLDCEPYGFRLWDHRLVAHKERSFEEYYQQISLRGEEFARAIWDEYPDLVLLLTFGYYVGDGDNPADHHYGLYPAFVDGLFAASPEDAVIVDGWEMSYGDRTREDLLRAYWWIRKGATGLSRVPDVYARKVRVGFGLWPDVSVSDDTPYAWDPADVSKNYYTPEELRTVLRCALETTDEYVWLYSGAINFCTGQNLPPAYREAMLDAKNSLYGLGLRELAQWAKWPLTEEFAKQHELIAQLPSEWRFRLDPTGEGRNWYFPEVDESSWVTVTTEEEWSTQAPLQDVSGVGWGRVQFDIPAEYQGRRLFLWFGALDEEGDIYLNGQHVYTWTGDFDRGWATPFPVEITGQALPGKTNVLAVKARATRDIGGVYRPVYLYTDRQ